MTIKRINPKKWNHPIEVIQTNVERNVPVTSDTWPDALRICDKNGTLIGYLRGQFLTGEYEGVMLETLRTVNGSTLWHGVRMEINSSGTPHVSVNYPEAWRSGLGCNNAGNLTTGTLPDARVSSGSTNASNDSTYISGGNFKITKKGKTVMVNAEAIAFKAFSGRKTVATVPAGYRPADVAYGIFNTGNGASNQGYFIVNTSGSIQVDGTGSAVTKYGTATYVIP